MFHIYDSAFMRMALRNVVEADSHIKVIGTARNGEEALEKIRSDHPDIVTMDIEMPVMDGLTAVKRIMMENPVPVIMVSALTEEGADATFTALDSGAVDFVPKSVGKIGSNGYGKVGELLRKKIKAIVMRNRLKHVVESVKDGLAGKGPKPHYRKPANDVEFKEEMIGMCDLVTIGVSTGGPIALNRILPRLPEVFKGSVFIVQHMPPTFTASFARRLNSITRIPVKEAEQGELMESGHVYIAPGGVHLRMKQEPSHGIRFQLQEEPSDSLFVPSIDVMMKSAVKAVTTPILGVIMTGMGRDGVEGMSAIKEKGGITIVQNEASCVVYGMPRVCVDRGIVDHIVALDGLPDMLIRYAG